MGQSAVARLRLDLSWVHILILRHDDVSKINGGLPWFMTYMISFLKENVSDGYRIAMGLPQATQLFAVANEGALNCLQALREWNEWDYEDTQ